MRSTRPEALTWGRSSSSRAACSELRSCPSSLCTNFSPASSFPGGGGATQCAARAPIGQTGRGRGACSLLCAARKLRGLEGGAPRCADPTAPRGAAPCGFPALQRGGGGGGVGDLVPSPQAGGAEKQWSAGTPGKPQCSSVLPLRYSEVGTQGGQL